MIGCPGQPVLGNITLYISLIDTTEVRTCSYYLHANAIPRDDSNFVSLLRCIAARFKACWSHSEELILKRENLAHLITECALDASLRIYWM
jgi:hypothetical protein